MQRNVCSRNIQGNRLGLAADETQRMLAAMPVAYAVTYIFGTVGSAILLAQILPRLMRIDLQQACKEYEKQFGSADAASNVLAWHDYELRTYALGPDNHAASMTVKEFENQFPSRNVFIEAIRRGKDLVPLSAATVIQQGDILAIGGDHAAVVASFDDPRCYDEVEDHELVNQPVTGIDVYVSHKDVDGKTLEELSSMANAHGVFIRRIRRGLTGTDIPVLAKTALHRGDVITLFGLDTDVNRAAKDFGIVDKHTSVADVAGLCIALVIGALIGAAIVKVGGVPITLSTAGGALIAGLVFGWLRSVRPVFGYIPEPTVWFMNSVGLNVFIAVVGITAGPNFVAGLKELGLSLFLWGMVATSLPLILGAFVGKYLFKFHPAILFGCCAGARTTTAALGMINEQAKSQVPGLGYTITYAVGNTLLTLWGMVIIMIMS